MAEKIYMRVQEVADELGISPSSAYKTIRALNRELEAMGYIVIEGRVDRKYFHDKLYATTTKEVKDQ